MLAMKKQILLFVLALLPIMASADAVEINGIYYNLNSETNQVEVTSNPNKYTGNVTIPDKVTHENVEYSVTSIVADAFYRCEFLTSIKIPGSVTSIGSNAFRYCNGLSLVIVKNQAPPAIDVSTFSYRAYLTLYVPKGSKEAYENADYWKDFKEIKEFANDEELNFSRRTIHVETAGTLSTLISANEKYLVEELTLSGELNGTDIHLLRNMAGVNLDNMDGEFFINMRAAETCGQLSFLDLSDATIVEGGRDYYRMQTSSAEDTWSDYHYTKANAISDCMFAEFRTLKQLILPRSVTQISTPLCDLYAWKTYPMGISVLKVADGNQYYDSRNDCNAIIETETNTLIAGCPTTTIPEDVTTIGINAFRAIKNMTSMAIPVGVTAINDYAFYCCSGLTSITIPSSVTSIGDCAFAGCNSLYYLTVEATTPPSILQNTFYDRANMVLHVPAGSVEAYASADYWKEFKGIGAIGAIVKGDFFSATTTEGVVLSYSVTNTSPFEAEVWGVGEYGDASFDKSTVTVINIPSSVIGLEGNEFRVTGIGNSAFSNCSNLTSISIPESVTNIGNGAFSNCSRLTSITIPEGLVSISDNTFSGCSGLSSITIPASVTSIGSSAFSSCRGLNSITIPDGVTSIGSSAFSGCSGLNSIPIPAGVTSISSYAFSSCTGLNSITIPANVTSISSYAFSYCTGLNSITISAGVTSIGHSAFERCSNLTSIIVDSDNPNYDSRNNCNAIIEKSTNTLITGCKSTIIPNGVTAIASSAFSNCSGLNSITIPAGVTSIGTSAFYGCSGLSSITIPTGVTSIAYYAFNGCTGLTSVSIPNSVTYISNYAFYGCKSLTSIIIPCNVTSIGSYAFYGCKSLTSIISEIKNPSSINQYAFSGIPSDIRLIVPKGTKSKYQATSGWNQFTNIVEAVDGDANGDNSVGIEDAMMVLSYILGDTPIDFNVSAADMNNDGMITIADALVIMDIILDKNN
jgi:hypothetical protein